MSGVDGGGLSAEERAQAYYEAEGWSGCAGSSWETLTEATRDGWRHAARLATRVAAAEQRAERVEFVRGWRTYDDGSRSPVERWVRAADGDWVSLDSTRRTSGDIHMDLANPAPRQYDDGGPRVREAVEQAEREHGSWVCGRCGGAPEEHARVGQPHYTCTYDPVWRSHVERAEPEVAAMQGVLAEVAAERGRQEDKWGQQNHPDGTGATWEFCSGQHAGWAQEAADDARRRCQEAGDRTWGATYALILNEEVAEAFAEDDPRRLRQELIQVAAVAVAWVECIDRRADALEGGEDRG